jgi:hypothetical protein
VTADTLPHAYFDERRLLRCGAVWVYLKATCRLHLQGRKNNASEETCFTVTNRLTPKRLFIKTHKAPHPRSRHSSHSPP